MGRDWCQLEGKHKCWTQGSFIRCILAVCLLILPNTSSASNTNKTSKPKLLNDSFVSFVAMDEEPKPYIRFCDTDSPIYDNDKTCNAIVGIVVHVDLKDTKIIGRGQVVASGIFIDDRHVLTSYNPFRQLRKNAVKKDLISINYLDAKAVVEVRNAPFYMGYFYGRTSVKCARQVVPVADEDITEDQWHDPEHTHTPLHDLMVMKTNETMAFCNNETWHDSNLTSLHNDTRAIHSGPLLATLADDEDEFPERFKIISLGYMDWDHVYNKNHLHTSRDYEFEDKVREDCEEWFPQDWGYFICIKNDEEFVSIGSGAVLVDTTNTTTEKDKPATIKVFGIGSFMLKKGEGSILVFTDVRPYNKEINRTCNYYDFQDN